MPHHTYLHHTTACPHLPHHLLFSFYTLCFLPSTPSSCLLSPPPPFLPHLHTAYSLPALPPTFLLPHPASILFPSKRPPHLLPKNTAHAHSFSPFHVFSFSLLETWQACACLGTSSIWHPATTCVWPVCTMPAMYAIHVPAPGIYEQGMPFYRCRCLACHGPSPLLVSSLLCIREEEEEEGTGTGQAGSWTGHGIERRGREPLPSSLGCYCSHACLSFQFMHVLAWDLACHVAGET